MAEARSNTLFLLDVSRSMADEASFDEQLMPKIQRAREYVLYKMHNIIDRGLKTALVGLTLFGASKSKNILHDGIDGSEGREGYEYIRDLVEIQPSSLSMIDTLHLVKPSKNSGDILSAIISAIATLKHKVGTKKQKMAITLITDGESETEWDQVGLKATLRQMNDLKIDLLVVGINFDDAETGYKEQNKSENKRLNEKYLRKLVAGLENFALIGNINLAILQASGPQIRTINSRAEKIKFCIGDDNDHPRTSFPISCLFKKATTRQGVKTAKKISTVNLPKGKKVAGVIDPRRNGKIKSDFDLKEYMFAKPKQTQEAVEEMYRQFASSQTQTILAGIDGQASQSQHRRTNMDMDPNSDEEDEEVLDLTTTHEVERRTTSFYVPKDEGKTDTELRKAGQNTVRAMKTAERNANRMEVDGVQAIGEVQEEGEKEEAPLEAVDADVVTEKAYKYGGTLVPVGGLEDAQFQMAKTPGIEVLSFMHKRLLKREMILGESYYVYGDPSNGNKDQLSFSALVMALIEKENVAIVRYTASRGAHAVKMGVLLPRSETGESGKSIQYCIFAQLPFAEDFRTFAFPSLSRLKTRSGKELTEHKLLPTDEINSAMATFVDSLDIDEAAEDGGPWFDCLDSYNPAIHNVATAIKYRRDHPDDTSLPPSHPAITKYLTTPVEVLQNSTPHLEKLKSLLEIKAVPRRKFTRGKRKLGDEDDGADDIDFEDFLGDFEDFAEGFAQTQTQANGSQANGVPSSTKSQSEKEPSPKRQRVDDDGSETETEDDEEAPKPAPSSSKGKEKAQIDVGEEGFIGMKDPIGDFKRLMEPEDSTMTRQAVRDMLKVVDKCIRDVGGRSTKLACQCLEVVRPAAIDEEEVKQYNDWLVELKKATTSFKVDRFWQEYIVAKSDVYGPITTKDTSYRGTMSVEAARELLSGRD